MPEATKLMVQKQGTLFTVHLDSLGRPIPVKSHGESPAGAFPFTCTSINELREKFPGFDYIFLEAPPRKPPPVIENDEIDASEVALTMQQAIRAPETVRPLPSQPKVAPANDARLRHAEEFLKRLEMAHTYASKKNRRTLDIQISVVRELINEVFHK